MDRHQEAAQLLLRARREPGLRMPALPDMLRPRTEEQAYLVQRGVMRESGRIGGWKVGRSGPEAFTCAPVPAGGLQAGPGRVSAAACTDRGVEAEIAVLIARDLPLRGQPYSVDEIRDAIGSAHPAIEVLQSRYVDVEQVDPLSNLADSLSHFGLVHGPAIPDWASVDLAAETVRLLVDGVEVKLRTGNPAGDMLPLVAWLANVGAAWANGLRAGQYVTTGSWTGKDFVPPGAVARIEFAHCGGCEVAFGP